MEYLCNNELINLFTMRNDKLFLTKCALFLVLMFTFWSCEKSSEIQKHNWELVWQDEFNTITADTLPDPAKWNYDEGAGGWGNAEWQYYTKSTKNVALDTLDGIGCLKITARYDGSTYTSARIKTQALFEQGYGRFEARIKMPWGPGMWPAFWLLGNNKTTVEWPRCGEIDIMEYKGQEPNRVHGTIHGPGLYSSTAITQTFGLENARFDTDYHVFAVEWTEGNIDFYVDNTLYKRITKEDVLNKGGEWVYDHPFYIILNLAVCGNFVGNSVVGTSFPQTMCVDYVRVYKEVN